MKKKIIAALSVVAILITVVAASFPASALTRSITLDTKVTHMTDGYGDMICYLFTPDVSGFYSFMSYNDFASEAYLVKKEVVDPSTNEKELVTIGFSNSSPDYKKYGQPDSLQFRLTSFLEKGVEYRFYAGWCFPTQESRQMTVKLTCDSYTDNPIESIEVACSANFSVYSGGEMRKDKNGNQYYYYDWTKLIPNMTVTVHYTDKSKPSDTVVGADRVGGFEIKYQQNQSEQHWYPQNSAEYTANTITISVLDKSVDYDVIIKNSALYTFEGRVLNILAQPVQNAVITNGTNTIAVTDSDGNFSCPLLPGTYNLSVSADHSIPRDFKATVTVDSSKNNHTAKPIRICTCDYVTDGYVNAKDYAYILKNGIDDKTQFRAAINYSKSKYVPIVLG